MGHDRRELRLHARVGRLRRSCRSSTRSCGWYRAAQRRRRCRRTKRRRCACCSPSGCGCFADRTSRSIRYKEDPTAPIWGKPPETVGGKLLVSGFWGIGRKLNYTGELMVYFSWTLCTGSESIVPYRAAAVAGVPVLASRVARRAALPRQVRRAVGRVLPARALSHDSVRVLMKLLTLGDYRRAARAKLSPMAWRYFRSGADAEETLRDKRARLAALANLAARARRRQPSASCRRRCWAPRRRCRF